MRKIVVVVTVSIMGMLAGCGDDTPTGGNDTPNPGFNSDVSVVRYILEQNGIDTSLALNVAHYDDVDGESEVRITELWLQQTNLNGGILTTLPSEVSQITRLNRIWLDGNQLTALPASIGDLSELQFLSLPDNNLTSLPSTIGELDNLTFLKVSGNQLTTFPSEISGCDSLGNILANNNAITALPNAIGSVSTLISLQLDNNLLSGLPETIVSLTNLQGFSIDYNKICTPLSATITTWIDDVVGSHYDYSATQTCP